MEIACDKPVDAYVHVDGTKFRDIQLALPINRHLAKVSNLPELSPGGRGHRHGKSLALKLYACLRRAGSPTSTDFRRQRPIG